MIVPSRRGFIAGALALVAAPAIVRAASLMPVKSYPLCYDDVSMRWVTEYTPDLADIDQLDVLYGKLLPRSEWVTIEADGTGTLPKGTRETVLRRIRFPREYTVTDGPAISVQAITDRELYRADYDFVKGAQWEKPMSALAVAIAAPVVVAKALEVPVSRRFFGKRDA